MASLGPLPKFSFAAEGYQPNILVAKRRLRPLGVQVVETFCDDNTVRPQRGALPFKDASIDLVTDRHESFVASEVFRILKPRGRFVTQQVGDSNYPELNDALGAKPHSMPMVWDLPEAVRQLEDAGLEVTDSREARLEAWFLDVGAVVYYLKAVPWQIPGFSSMTYHDRLLDLHLKIQKEGPFRVTSSRFLIQATKP